MKSSVRLIGAILLSSAAAGVMADEEGAGDSLLCAVTHTVSCDSLGDCFIGPASAVNLPVFLRFDRGKRVVETARQGGERRTSNVVHVSDEGDAMVFLGDEGDSGWSAMISKSTGSLTGTVAEQGVGYMIFGSCLSN